MLGRYAELKAQLPPGTILFYQVGTFFETFEEDAKTISREVSRILTPGTVIEDNVLSAGQANYLAAVVVRDGTAGVAVVEASTGEFTGSEVPRASGWTAGPRSWGPRVP